MHVGVAKLFKMPLLGVSQSNDFKTLNTKVLSTVVIDTGEPVYTCRL